MAERPRTWHKGFSILPILERSEFNRRQLHCRNDENAHSEFDEQAQAPQLILRGSMCQSILMRQHCFEFERREVWISEVRK